MNGSSTERDILRKSLVNATGDEELAERVLIFIGKPKPKIKKTLTHNESNLLKRLWRKLKK